MRGPPYFFRIQIQEAKLPADPKDPDRKHWTFKCLNFYILLLEAK